MWAGTMRGLGPMLALKSNGILHNMFASQPAHCGPCWGTDSFTGQYASGGTSWCADVEVRNAAPR